jgi:hypothetical protein
MSESKMQRAERASEAATERCDRTVWAKMELRLGHARGTRAGKGGRRTRRLAASAA